MRSYHKGIDSVGHRRRSELCNGQLAVIVDVSASELILPAAVSIPLLRP